MPTSPAISRASRVAPQPDRKPRVSRGSTGQPLAHATLAALVVAVNERGVAAVSRDAFVSRPTIYRALAGGSVIAAVQQTIQAATAPWAAPVRVPTPNVHHEAAV